MLPNGNDTYTKVLLHFDGADASTVITDSEVGTPKTVTANGNAQIDTAQSKFGGASCLFDGNGDFIDIAASTDFDFSTGDFTIDLWVRPDGVQNDGSNIFAWQSFITFLAYTGGSYQFLAGPNPYVQLNLGQLTDLTWSHVAIVRYGNTFTAYVNGTSVATDVFTLTAGGGTGSVYNGSGTWFKGWIDEFRISKGVARWVTNFTPPTVAYSSAQSSTQYDFPNPNLIKNAAGAANKSQADVRQQPLNVSVLVGKDIFFGTAGYAPDYDWPNPNLLRNAQSAALTSQANFRQQPLNVSYLVGKDTFFRTSGYAPTYDWPNPRGPNPFHIGIRNESYGNVLTTTLVKQDRIYAGPGQVPTHVLPNPRGYEYPLSLRIYNQALVTSFLKGKDTFYAGSGQVPTQAFPNPPLGKEYPSSLRIYNWLSPNTTTLLGKDRFFGLAGHPTFDWPVPKGAIPGISLRTHADPYKRHLAGKDLFFGAFGQPPKVDWVNPNLGKPYPVSLRTHIDPVRIKFIGKDIIYAGYGQVPVYRYPNPGIPLQPNDLITWLNQLNPNLRTVSTTTVDLGGVYATFALIGTDVWIGLHDTQTPSWLANDDSQTGTWQSITDSQTPNWAGIDDSDSADWEDLNTSSTTTWTRIET